MVRNQQPPECPVCGREMKIVEEWTNTGISLVYSCPDEYKGDHF